MDGPLFLTTAEVLRLHDMQLDRFGGLAGIRDPGLLESALAMPSASFGGEYLHRGIFEMAAAYLLHIARDHPFVDGNKRVALHSAIVFLRLNGFRLEADPDALYELTLSVATGAAEKPEIARFLRDNSAERR